jgi:hypothetical protein
VRLDGARARGERRVGERGNGWFMRRDRIQCRVEAVKS